MPEKILIIISNLSTASLPSINPEIQKIRTAITATRAKKYIEELSFPAPTYQSLSDLLTSQQAESVTMLHYMGHSNQTGLTIEWEEGNNEIKEAEFVTLLKAHKKIRFVFLNSCYSETIAKQLKEAGVPFVIGTTYKIKDEKAAQVAEKFYSILSSEGKSIKEAFDLTRDYFTSDTYKEDQVIREAFRGFGEEETPENIHPWKLYTKEDISDADKNWVLVPVKVRNMKLSGSDGEKSDLRVLCLYNNKNRQCEELFKIIKNQFDADFKEVRICFQGINEINNNDSPAIEDIKKESSAAE